jgi:predicted DNA-binding transcriptional regulator YafY
MVYWTASRNETTRRDFDPYELSLVDDGWYVFGYCRCARRCGYLRFIVCCRSNLLTC